MRVLMLSWEYPPVLVGGLGRHVHALARELTAQGHDVVVLCRQPSGTDASTHPTTDTVSDGVRILRVAEDPPHLIFERDLVAWTLAMGHAMLRAGFALLSDWKPEVVHAHDWLVAHPAIALSHAATTPLVTTVHATEAGRHGGWLREPHSQQIHSVEWWLARSSDALITCSAAMRAEVAHLFDVDPTAVTVLHNGIAADSWRPARGSTVQARRQFRGLGTEPLLVYFGRLEREKGVHDLLEALPTIRNQHPGARLVIAGHGTCREPLEAQIAELGLGSCVEFTGQLGDRDLRALLSSADTVVLPSHYEPFGITALEAAAVGIPLVASTAGGLGEFVHDGRTGYSFEPGDIAELSAAVTRALSDPTEARRRADAAGARLTAEFQWSDIAADTARLYATTAPSAPRTLPRPKIPTGNVLG